MLLFFSVFSHERPQCYYHYQGEVSAARFLTLDRSSCWTCLTHTFPHLTRLLPIKPGFIQPDIHRPWALTQQDPFLWRGSWQADHLTLSRKTQDPQEPSTHRAPHILKADPMHFPKSLFQGAEESTSCMRLPRQRVQFRLSKFWGTRHPHKAGRYGTGLSGALCPSRKAAEGQARPGVQARDSSPLSVIVSTSEHFLY